MTYNELCADITALGFETEIDSRERTLSAINRALLTIYTERPLYSSVSIYKPHVNPASRIEHFCHKGGEVDSFSYNAKAYSFTTSGIGQYKIIEGEKEEVYEFSQNSELHRGFLHGDGRIEFHGQYSYSVFDFLLFDEIYGEDLESIPSTPEYTEYSVYDYAKDFLSFVYPPTDDTGNAISGAMARGGKIFVPANYFGKVNLVYKKAPEKVSGNPEDEIVLPDGCEHLLALLAASYIWLDDDSDKAEYYMSLYREAMSAVKYYDRPYIDNSYQNINGWA